MSLKVFENYLRLLTTVTTSHKKENEHFKNTFMKEM